MSADKRKYENGVTYVVPHLDFDTEPPYDLSEATQYERQEIRHVWRDAQRAARAMHECADLWLHRLDEAELFNARMNASGGSIPLSCAQDLTLCLVRLNEKLDAMEHRIALVKRAAGG